MTRLQKLVRYWLNVVKRYHFRNRQKIFTSIMTVAAGVKAASEDVEPKFLEMGHLLQVIYSDVTGLTRQVRKTAKQLTDPGEENFLNKVAALAGNSRDALDHHQARLTVSLKTVKAVTDHLTALFESCGQIDRIAMNLRVVGFNIGVESTRSVEAEDMFSVVSEEIVHLSEKVVSTGNIIREDAHAALTAQISDVENISKGLAQLQRLSTDAAGIVTASMTEIESCMNTATDVFDHSGRKFDSIRRQVGEIVAGIQFHDNMRQRVEHIGDALTGGIGRVNEKRSAEDAAGFQIERLGELHHVTSLQTGQLTDVIEEISRVHRESVGAFEDIGREIKALSQIMAGVFNGSPGEDAATEDPFTRLIDVLNQLNGLIARADQLADQIEESILRSADVGDRFSQYMKTLGAIGFETHIKALNAIVKAAHLGQKGKTLEVLAQEMRQLSKETGGFVGNVEEHMRQISECISKLRHQSPDMPGSEEISVQNREDPVKTLCRGMDGIGEIKAHLQEELCEASRLAKTLFPKITNGVEELAFLPSLADSMTGYLTDLLAAMRLLQPFGEKDGKNTAANPGVLAGEYTMQREREIHEALFSDQEKTSLEIEISADEDAAGFHENRKDNASAPIELFVESKEEIRQDDDPSLGDNVELF